MSGGETPNWGILRDRNFLIYWAGTAVSLFGDAISTIALPWLILQMTDDPRRLGIVLAVQALPRALFMLFGGAAADKYSPRKVLLASRGISIFVIGALGLFVIGGLMKVWMIYPFALVLGTIGAFHLPAATSIIPTLVSSDHLRAANSAFNGTAQLSMLAGPALAGLLIVLFSGEGAAGIGYAFLVDASTFVIGTISLAFVTARKSGAPEHHRTIGERLKSGIAYALADAGIRGILLFIVAANFFIIGVMVVGLPVFADQALDLGAEGFGYLMSAIGGGSLLGTVLAGVLPSPPIGRRGLVLFPLSAGAGLMLGALPFAGALPMAMGIIFVTGVFSGFANIHFLTWLQKRVDGAMIGRVMSLVMLASFGVMPLSAAIAGFVVDLAGLTVLMTTAGLAYAAIALGILANPVLRRLETQEEETARLGN